MQDEVVVLGNGESRKDLYLPQLKDKIISVGCNAIHRDFIPNHLVCCDKRMVREAQKNSNINDTVLYTRPEWSNQFSNVENVPALPYISVDRKDTLWHWTSGPIAVLLAAKLNLNVVHMVGFDLWDTFGKVNNVYKGSSNYSNVDANPVDPSYWEYQIRKVFENFPQTSFIIYNHDYWMPPHSWKEYENVSFKTLKNFKEHLQLI